MRRRLKLSLLSAVVGALALAAQSAGQTGLGLAEATGSTFPDRVYILSTPTATTLEPPDVHVLENGSPVSSVGVVPASAAEGVDFGVVLAIDASNSMRGAPIEGAMAAARAFAARRPDSQKLAVLVFNGQTRVLLQFTTDKTAIQQTLAATPALAEGTKIYDAVDAALGLFRNGGIEARSLILISDGSDTASDKSLTDIVEAAQADRVRVFTVGLRSRAFNPTALETLAASASGEFVEAATPKLLAGLFDKLGTQLANEYLIKYRSLAGPDLDVKVEVRVDGVPGVAAAAYKSPSLSIAPAKPFSRSFLDRFWGSSWSLVVIAIVCAGLVGFAVQAVFRPSQRSLRERMGEFISLPTKGDDTRAALAGKVLVGAERSLEGQEWWGRFSEKLEIAKIKISAVEIVIATAAITIVAGWILVVLFGEWPYGLLGIAVPLAVRVAIERAARRQRQAFAEQLPDNLDVLASALRAGHSFAGALSVVVNDAGEPARSEFRRVIADEQLGVPLEDAMGQVVRRMQSRELEYVALVSALQRETGGNTAEVLDRVTATIRERFQLRRTIRTLTAQGRMARWIVSILPLAIVAAIMLMNPAYLDPLWDKSSGRILVVVSGVMVVAGSLVIRKIVNIRV